MTWRHDELADDLAAHLRGGTDRLVWTDMQLGPVGSPRPDVYALSKSFARFQPLAYEIKVSRSDCRADVTCGKWQSYLRYASGVLFAAPVGLLTPSDLPAGCGLMVRGDKGWRTVRKPTLQQLDTLPRAAWLKLVIDGAERAWAESAPRRASAWSLAHDERRRLAEDVAAAVQDIAAARAQVEMSRAEAVRIIDRARNDAERIRQSARTEHAELTQLRADLCTALGLPEGTSSANIRRAAAQVMAPVSAVARSAIPSVEYLLRDLQKIAAQMPSRPGDREAP